MERGDFFVHYVYYKRLQSPSVHCVPQWQVSSGHLEKPSVFSASVRILVFMVSPTAWKQVCVCVYVCNRHTLYIHWSINHLKIKSLKCKLFTSIMCSFIIRLYHRTGIFCEVPGAQGGCSYRTHVNMPQTRDPINPVLHAASFSPICSSCFCCCAGRRTDADHTRARWHLKPVRMSDMRWAGRRDLP